MDKKVNISAIKSKMHFIYKDEREKNIAAIVIYNKDGKFFFDPEYKNEMTNLEVEALLLRGALVDRGGKYYRPSSFNENNVSFSDAVINPEDIEVDLSAYVTKEELSAQLEDIDIDLSDYVTKEELNGELTTIENAISDAETNMTTQLNTTKAEILDQVKDSVINPEDIEVDLSGYVTKEELSGQLDATKDEIMAQMNIYAGNGSIINVRDGSLLRIWVGTQTQYDSLLSKEDDVVYLIEGSYTPAPDTPEPEPEPEPDEPNPDEPNPDEPAKLTCIVGKTCDSFGNISDDPKKGLTDFIPIPTGLTSFSQKVPAPYMGMLEDHGTYTDPESVFFVVRCFDENKQIMGTANPSGIAAVNRELYTGTAYIRCVVVTDETASADVTEDFVNSHKIIIFNNALNFYKEYPLHATK